MFISCKTPTSRKEGRLYLDKNWSYSIQGTKPDHPFTPIDIKNLDTLSEHLLNRTGYIWLKADFYAPDELKYIDTAIFLGRIKIAAKTYINGHFIGQTGFFPPHEYSEGERSSAFKIPREYLNFGGNNQIVMVIWCHGRGRLYEIPFISDNDDVNYTKEFCNLVYSKIYFILSIVLLLISAIYFFLYFLRKTEKENLSFAELNLSTSFFLLNFYYGEYSIIYKNVYSLLLFEKLFHGIPVIFACYFVVSFARDFMKYNESLPHRIFRFCLAGISIIILFTATDLNDFMFKLKYAYTVICIQFLYAAKIIILTIKKQERKVLLFLLCFIPVYLALIWSLISFIFLNNPLNTLFISIAWQCVIFCFLALLIIRFVQLANKVEFMNKNLERLVEERTNDLEKEKERALHEIEFAGFVQNNFYQIDTSDLKGWELEYFSKPMAGVSGDLYTAFIKNHNLNGVGIFDISGHGIASGLVTMLAKNIIEQEFNKNLKRPLEEVLSDINKKYINDKGNIENYFTGLIIRIKKDYLELSNAGHPKAILYQKQTGELHTIEQEGVNQYGAIGLSGFPVNFQSLRFEMQKGDELLLYTDGITDSVNSERQYFGLERIMTVFKSHISMELKNQVQAINDVLIEYTGKQSFDDDITYIILRKK